jgi:hypothetical protein
MFCINHLYQRTEAIPAEAAIRAGGAVKQSPHF